MTTDAPTIESLLDQFFDERQMPRATYRLQFRPDFTFQDARQIVDYLHRLGISDVYTSPLYQPRQGSTHGYDTVDYNRLNDRLGSEDDFDALVNELDQYGMGLLLDIVPNHMGIGRDNPWWMDVLKHGPSSVYSHYFDIDWQPKNRALDNKVLIPVLGDHYGRVLEKGELELVYWHGDFYLHYWENQYPITPDTYAYILQTAHDYLIQHYQDAYVEEELLSIITALGHIPPYSTRDTSQLQQMRREQKVARRRFVNLYENSEAFRESLDEALKIINGTVGNPDSFELLDTILEHQPYRLSFWRVASDEINYRRFFNINDMAAIRIEHDEVFAKTHQLTFNLLGEGKISGLRIDHPDGLWNPKLYFHQLQEEYLVARLQNHLPEVAIDRDVVRQRLAELTTTDEASDYPLYVLVEKILSETEPLPYDWAVYGTTGYDFMLMLSNLFVDAINEEAFDRIYHEFVGDDIDYEAIIQRSKRFIMSETLNSELYARSSQLADIVELNPRYRGFTRHSLERALIEITAALPIYRTYITYDEPVSERDIHYMEDAAEIAKERNPRMPTYLIDFVRDMILLRLLDDFDDSLHEDIREFVMQYQQMTGPVMAKSVEDTTFYVYNRLTSLNEVGGHPEQFGMSVDDFHAFNQRKLYPHTMLSTSTHDTKRSEDVRARINVLSEMPDEWHGAITEWAKMNKDAKQIVEGEAAPSANDEYLLYQTLVGTFPNNPPDDVSDYQERITGYMRKAVNEAKVHSNWVNSNEPYHDAMAHFIARMLENDEFMDSLTPFAERVAFFGFLNSLAQVLLKITTPGVPDIYQGNELWRYSLVDPDNRRPVDFEQRRQLLDDLMTRKEDNLSALLSDLTNNPSDGAIKMYLTATALAYRQEQEPLFLEGTYHPLTVNGRKKNHVVAFERILNDVRVMVVIPRLVVGLLEGQLMMPMEEAVWQDTHIVLSDDAETTYRNIFTGATVSADESDGQFTLSLSDILSEFPVAMLTISE